MEQQAIERAEELRIFQKYGLRKQQFKSLWLRAGGKCEICRVRLKSKLVAGSSGQQCSVDHCHESGEVRGLLCNECNIGLGRFKDNADSLATAIDYLSRGTTGVSNPEKVGLKQVEKQEQEEADRAAGIERDSKGRIRGGKSGNPRNRRRTRKERVAAIRGRRGNYPELAEWLANQA